MNLVGVYAESRFSASVGDRSDKLGKLGYQPCNKGLVSRVMKFLLVELNKRVHQGVGRRFFRLKVFVHVGGALGS